VGIDQEEAREIKIPSRDGINRKDLNSFNSESAAAIGADLDVVEKVGIRISFGEDMAFTVLAGDYHAAVVTNQFSGDLIINSHAGMGALYPSVMFEAEVRPGQIAPVLQFLAANAAYDCYEFVAGRLIYPGHFVACRVVAGGYFHAGFASQSIRMGRRRFIVAV